MEWFLYSWPTLVILGIGLRMALRLTYGARGPEPGDPIYVFLNTAAWVLLGLGIAPAIVGGTLTLAGGILGILAATTLVEMVMHQRAAQRQSMSKLLALLVERGQQLDSSTLFAGQAMQGIVGRAAERLLATVRRGTPLVEAVSAHPRALPPHAVAYVAAGHAMHAEAAALRELSRSDDQQHAGLWRALIDRISYIVFVLLIMVVVMTFIMIQIVPEFQRIFWEFNVELPQVTLLAIKFSNFFAAYLAAPIGAAVSISVMGGIVIGICYLSDIPVLRPWGDLVFRNRGTSHVLRILALAAELRQPFTSALAGLAFVYPSAVLRSRLSPVAAAVQSGAHWCDALSKSRLISDAESALLKSAERAGNLPWALRQIATRRQRRNMYRLAATVHMVYPLLILAFGALVGFFVVALFVPIVALIQGLT